MNAYVLAKMLVTSGLEFARKAKIVPASLESLLPRRRGSSDIGGNTLEEVVDFCLLYSSKRTHRLC